MNSRNYLRPMALAVFVMALSFFNFSRLEGAENIRSIHIVTLLVCGMGIGIFIQNLAGYIRSKRKNSNSH